MATATATRRRTRGRRRRARSGAIEQPGVLLFAAVAAGVALGLLSAINDEWPRWIQVFNLGAPWVLGAFGVGYFARSPAGGAVVGLVALLVAVAAYYTGGLLLGIREYASTAAQSTQVWGAVALVVGPTLGVAGHFVRRRQEWPRAVAGAVLAAALWGEAAWISRHGLRMPWELASAGLGAMSAWAAWGLIALGLAAALAIPLSRRGNALHCSLGWRGRSSSHSQPKRYRNSYAAKGCRSGSIPHYPADSKRGFVMSQPSSIAIEPSRHVIVAGYLRVDPGNEERYLQSCEAVVALARTTAGCLDFAIGADLVEPGRDDHWGGGQRVRSDVSPASNSAGGIARESGLRGAAVSCAVYERVLDGGLPWSFATMNRK